MFLKGLSLPPPHACEYNLSNDIRRNLPPNGDVHVARGLGGMVGLERI